MTDKYNSPESSSFVPVLPRSLVFRVVEGVPLLICPSQKLFLRVPYGMNKFINTDLSESLQVDKQFEIMRETLSRYGVPTARAISDWPRLEKIQLPPDSIRLEITNKCNMKCRYCFNSSGPSETDTLSTQQVIQTIDEFVDLGGRLVIFSGGEPLLHPGVIEILTHSTNKVSKTCLATNGLLLSGELLEKIACLPIHITVSLDSLTPEPHDFNRGVGSFGIVYDNLKTIIGQRQRLCHIGIVMTVTASNYNCVKTMVDFVKENNLEYLAICLPKRQGRACECWESICLTTAQQSDLYEYVSEQCISFAGIVDIEGAHYNQVNAMLFRKDRPVLNCRPGESLKVTADGKVFSCPQTNACVFEIGHVASGGLRQAMNGDRLRSIRQHVWERLLRLKECSGCDWLYFCQGGCPCDALDAHSDMDRPDSFCSARKLAFERALTRLVREGETDGE